MIKNMRKTPIIVWTLLVLAAGLLVSLIVSDTFAANRPAEAASIKAAAPKAAKLPRGSHRQGRFLGINVVSEAAAILGVKPIDIMNEMIAGKTLGEIAKDKGYTQEQFLAKLTQLETDTINVALKAGTIPQEQADALLEGMQDRLMSALDLKAVDVSDPSQSGGMAM